MNGHLFCDKFRFQTILVMLKLILCNKYFILCFIIYFGFLILAPYFYLWKHLAVYHSLFIQFLIKLQCNQINIFYNGKK